MGSKIQYYQKVLLPITVSIGDYCWGPHPTEPERTVVCPHFDNEGGHPCCGMMYDLPTYSDPDGWTKKAISCKNLKLEVV